METCSGVNWLPGYKPFIKNILFKEPVNTGSFCFSKKIFIFFCNELKVALHTVYNHNQKTKHYEKSNLFNRNGSYSIF